MEDKYLFIVRDQDGDICGMCEGPEVLMDISSTARLIKTEIDLARQQEGEPFAECCEVWLREQPYRLHLLATFF